MGKDPWVAGADRGEARGPKPVRLKRRGRRLPAPVGTDGRRPPRNLYKSLPDACSENVYRGLLEAVSGIRLMTRPTAPTGGLPVPDRWPLACGPAVAPTAASGARRPTPVAYLDATRPRCPGIGPALAVGQPKPPHLQTSRSGARAGAWFKSWVCWVTVRTFPMPRRQVFPLPPGACCSQAAGHCRRIVPGSGSGPNHCAIVP